MVPAHLLPVRTAARQRPGVADEAHHPGRAVDTLVVAPHGVAVGLGQLELARGGVEIALIWRERRL
jgi:hypothetical protein